jgi:hypothetical protein
VSTAPPGARPPGQRPAHPGPLPIGTRILVAVLLLIPVLALMLIPTYARSGPRIWGFPFFFWYQMVWVFIAAGFTYAAYHLIAKARGVK